MKPRSDADPAFDGLEPPNHTQIPNTLLDDLMQFMECSELKVTLAICRQTFGWHKKEDELSLSQLKAMTGLSRQSVITGIEDGMRRGVIKRRPRGQGYVYRIQLVQSLDQLRAKSVKEPPKSQQLVQSLDQSSLTIRPVDGLTSPMVRPELVQKLDTQKKGKKDHDPTPPTPTHDSRTDGDGDDRTFLFLTNEAIGAAAEFADLPYDLMRADYDARRKDGQSKANIVRAWRLKRPTTAYHYAPASNSAPLTATRPNVPETTISPAEMLDRMRARNEPSS